MFKKWFQNKKTPNRLGTKHSNTKTLKKNKERINMESIEAKEVLILHQVQSPKMMIIRINIKMKVQKYSGMNKY
jgi:hypothetical protein